MLNYALTTVSEINTNTHLQGQHSICTTDHEESESFGNTDCSRTVTNGHATLNRVLELSKLKNGWYGDEIESKGPSGLSVAHALRILEAFPKLLESVSVYPMYEGGILFEFKSVKWDYSLRICDTGSFEIYGIEIDGDKGFEAVFDKYEDAVVKMLDVIDIE